MLDDQVREVLARLEREDDEERERGLDVMQRSRAVAPATGRFLFALVAPNTACEVLEIGGSRGYSSIWLGAGVRYLGGRVLSLEKDPPKAEAWRKNVEDAGLSDWVELIEGDAYEILASLEDIFDVVFLDSEKDDYEALFALGAGAARARRAGRRGQRALPRRDARHLQRGPPGRPHAVECHAAARPRARVVGRPVASSIVRVPRKGGGPTDFK